MLRVGVIVRNDTQKERMIFTGTNQVKTGKRKRIITGAVKERRWEVKKAGGKKEEEEGDLYQRDRRKTARILEGSDGQRAIQAKVKWVINMPTNGPSNSLQEEEKKKKKKKKKKGIHQ